MNSIEIGQADFQSQWLPARKLLRGVGGWGESSGSIIGQLFPLSELPSPFPPSEVGVEAENVLNCSQYGEQAPQRLKNPSNSQPSVGWFTLLSPFLDFSTLSYRRWWWRVESVSLLCHGCEAGSHFVWPAPWCKELNMSSSSSPGVSYFVLDPLGNFC